MRWTFDYEATDRKRWPSHFGRVTVISNSYWEAFDNAFFLVSARRGVEMVTALHYVE